MTADRRRQLARELADANRRGDRERAQAAVDELAALERDSGFQTAEDGRG